MILAIETSCDETSVAVVHHTTVLSNVLLSQIKFHQKYGGVVPELASRLHAESIDGLVNDALTNANVALRDLTHIAVTVGPGLEGALLVGITAANMLAGALGIPLIPVNHLHAHIYASVLAGELVFPALVCLASGGHTMIVAMKDHLQFELVANTMDDACGECFDKVARMLNLPYPGGPHIEQLAKSGRPIIQLPHPVKHQPEVFSFSGLKTAVLTQLQTECAPADMAASVQHRIGTVLSTKLNMALKSHPSQQVVLCGGVFANQYIRDHITASLSVSNCMVPPLPLCTDNAAMVGLAANYYLIKGRVFSQYYRCHPQMALRFPEAQ
jgi:N6-L-threonylcarbamoyladenine synthase